MVYFNLKNNIVLTMFISYSVLIVRDEVRQVVVRRRRGWRRPVPSLHAAVRQRPLALVDGPVRAVLPAVRQLLARAGVWVRARTIVYGPAATGPCSAATGELVARRLWRWQGRHATPTEITPASKLRLQRLALPTETTRSSSERTFFEHKFWWWIYRPVVPFPRPAQAFG